MCAFWCAWMCNTQERKEWLQRVSCGCAYIFHEYPTSFQLPISACHADLTELAPLVLILDAVTLA